MGFWSSVKSVGKLLPVVGPVVSALDDKTPDTSSADTAAARARDVADQAKQHLDEARDRHTQVDTLPPSTAADVKVGPAPIQSETVNVNHAGPTHAPDEVRVDPVYAATVYEPGSVSGIGSRIAGSGDDVADAGTQNWQVDRTGAGYQNEAALALQNALSGKAPSVAMEQLKASQDRAAAEQLSQAAGARGQNVASAKRNAALNTSLANVEFGGQAAQLRAKEIADAATGLGQLGTQVQGQALQETSTKTGFNQQVELENAKARDTAIQASRERFARGELTQAQLETDIAKANADYTQRTGEVNQKTATEVKLDHAHQQLQSDLASDERLQHSFDLEAQYEAQARAGNQDASVKLQALQGQIDADIHKFNANQIQTADGTNIRNRLDALRLDDQFVESMTNAWLQAEQNGDASTMAALRAKMQAAVNQAEQDKQWHDAFKADVKDVAKAVATKGMDTSSDVRVKEEIIPVDGVDVDGFLKSIENTSTWKYKPGKGRPEGRKIGVMAQDVATSPLGLEAVGTEDDGTLNLDYQKLAALALAGLGRLNQRMEIVEGKKGKPGPDVVGYLKSRGDLKPAREAR